MSIYAWTQVPFREKDRALLYVPGVAIGGYSVSPAMMNDAPEQFSTAVWRVSEIHYGVMIVCYTDFNVALNFARYLDRCYGDISALAYRYVNQHPPTNEDKRILAETYEKRQHVCMHNDEWIEYIPFNQEDY